VTLLNGISEQTLRQLNSKLDENCTLIEGQELLIGLVETTGGTPTPGPSPTALPPTASPTPFTGTTEICVLLFEDQNGDAAQETVINPDPEAYQGICFSDVPEGTYNITVGIPDNYNPTTGLTSRLDVNAGDRATVSFGSQSQDIVVDPGAEEPTVGGGRSPVLGIIGFLLLAGGGVLGYYAWRSGKPESKLSGGNILKK
jgi:hypothetical protein